MKLKTVKSQINGTRDNPEFDYETEFLRIYEARIKQYSNKDLGTVETISCGFFYSEPNAAEHVKGKSLEGTNGTTVTRYAVEQQHNGSFYLLADESVLKPINISNSANDALAELARSKLSTEEFEALLRSNFIK